MKYFLNEYPALLGYLDDGRFEIDNNLVENDIRPAAVGRKRWLFIFSSVIRKRDGAVRSFTRCCRVLGAVARLPSLKITQIRELLPGYWKPPLLASSG